MTCPVCEKDQEILIEKKEVKIPCAIGILTDKGIKEYTKRIIGIYYCNNCGNIYTLDY